MDRRTCVLWKVGITVAGMLLLLVLMTWVPVSAATVRERASGSATKGSVTAQATPTEDATKTALEKEKLDGEIAGQQHTLGNWLWNNVATILSSFLSTLVIVIGALVGLWRWRKDQRTELEKRAEERFQAAVTGLGNEKEGAKVGAAILLRTFLRPGYEQFYTQTFDLAVANLRLRYLDPAVPEPLTSLSQALVMVFKESFPLARKKLKQSPQFLDASCIQLDNAHLTQADLRQVWLPEASLRNAALRRTDLSEAALYKANLAQADLKEAILMKTNLYKANLVGVDLSEAHLSQADLRSANLQGANLQGANLREANFQGANLGGADLDCAYCLEDTNLRKVKGLTKEQLEACKAKGAIIDKDLTTNVSLSVITSTSPSQNNNQQTSSVLSPQENAPPSHVDENSAVVPAQDRPDENS
ncbi:hypothetical protein KSF_085570 [Reticulibacter mediterranei]|uniref:Pentapeptide repeat-containing protein n=1 Tax=Reticulibacter mediterranei TaxID=2778369 RepID=A0A8J3IVA5_9CHLR|nr:pentapeptide repeat-containing protein [Reticulibacter mediterranei]GHO98509.1 hypothetical protein KSF_085570 [Reticulibacter mediterranei]